MGTYGIVLALLLCSVQSAAADASKIVRDMLAESTPAFETQDFIFYGKDSQTDTNFCYVSTLVDLLTDEEYPQITCAGPGISVDISSNQYEPLSLSLYVGEQRFPYKYGESIPMTLRFYPGPVLKYSGTALAGMAKVTDPQIIDSILIQLADEGKLVAVIGTKSGVIKDLTGASQAVRDFKKRISTGQQVLEVQP